MGSNPHFCCIDAVIIAVIQDSTLKMKKKQDVEIQLLGTGKNRGGELHILLILLSFSLSLSLTSEGKLEALTRRSLLYSSELRMVTSRKLRDEVSSTV